ncbi:MAG: SET domain-containing protein-lysine N-methyltransferase [Alphaproteobacteria bacterium]
MAAAAPRHERARNTLRPIPNDRLEIRHDPLKGRGVFARAMIGAGALIEVAPVIIVPAAQRKLLDTTTLHDYYFLWDDTGGESRVAIALGLVSLCNHSRRPSARVRRNRIGETLDLLALTPIAAECEITIDYNCPLWFAVQD